MNVVNMVFAKLGLVYLVSVMNLLTEKLYANVLTNNVKLIFDGFYNFLISKIRFLNFL